MINGAPISATGRVAVDTGIPAPTTFNGALGYSSTGALCVNTANGLEATYNGGFAFIAGGRLKIRDIQDTAMPGEILVDYNQGIPTLRATHEVICTSTAAVAQWNHGWPQAANGAVCIGVGDPVVNAFTEGFDTGFD